MSQIEEMVIVKQFAREFHMTSGSVYNWISQNRCPIPFVKIGRKVLFRRSDIEKLKNPKSK